MQPLVIEYRFRLLDTSEELFSIRLDPQTLETLPDTAAEPLPDWTALTFVQCSSCPLTETSSSHCPAAANLAPIVQRGERLMSIDMVDLQVTTAERITLQKTTAQRALCSLMGLVIAGSSCPHTAFFKPMARFHLPLASEEETIFRATATYMLSQYFVKNEGGEADFNLEKLTNLYRTMEEVNLAMAKRVRSASKTDSSVNAIVLLDMYAKALPYVIKQSLEELRYLFAPFLNQSPLRGNPPQSDRSAA
ncbi:MAG: hypothetical protein OEV89_01800 [Desulfobulbaceae bacterium]|nr:hypothetical protein [Desulfobulbaceae bacterium]HIJ89573.1 hypothetical protein [Deltaproteobacteria bacterium]